MELESSSSSSNNNNDNADPIVLVNNPSLLLLRHKSVIGTLNNTSISFAILSRTHDQSRVVSLAIFNDRKGFWGVENLFNISTSKHVNLTTCKSFILISGSMETHVIDRSAHKRTLTLPTTDLCQEGSCGIGFDVATGNYKVVRLLSCGLCQVFNVGSYCPWWRGVENNLTIHRSSWYSVENASPIYANGFISWMVRMNKNNCRGILCFDVGAEKLKLFAIPLECDFSLCSVSLVALRGHICVALHDKEEMRVDIWMVVKEVNDDQNDQNLQQQGDAGRRLVWAKEYNIDVSRISYFNQDITPVCIRNQRIFFQSLKFGLVSYHITDKIFTTIHQYCANTYWVQCGAYEEVLTN